MRKGVTLASSRYTLLSPVGQLVIKTVRGWLDYHRLPDGLEPHWTAPLTAAGLNDSCSRVFDMLLRMIIGASNGAFQSSPLEQEAINFDEMVLLGALVAAQQQDQYSAAALLKRWFRPDQLSLAWTHASMIVMVFDRAGFDFSDFSLRPGSGSESAANQHRLH